ncbi:alpha/beta fold hydrolase [Halorientalis marina]|uniref:alpha/beta fold hydrolase n=1 Tax=Halorientalis marina TaxID=2931976 RepID=UPI001FF21D6A|nr:alpha/beta hydrolase [Halorientalis marina]
MNHEAWSTDQQETTVTVDGHDLTVAYRDEGEGHPVVLLHGIPTWSFLWRDVAPALEDDFRVIAPDLVGYGNSAMQDGFDRSVRAQEQMLADLLGQLGVDSFSLVAHDIGGGVAVRYAAHEPDAVENLVMSNAVCYDSWPVEFITNLGLPRTTEMPLDTLEEQVGGAFSEGVYADEADPEFVEGMTQQWTTEEGRTSLSRNAVSTNTNHTTEIDYDAITADLLCLWGADDTFQPLEYGERLAEDLDGEVVELDAYHWVVEDRPNRYATEVKEFVGQ